MINNKQNRILGFEPTMIVFTLGLNMVLSKHIETQKRQLADCCHRHQYLSGIPLLVRAEIPSLGSRENPESLI